MFARFWRHLAPAVDMRMGGLVLSLALALPVPALAGDSDWLAARDAFRKGDDAALQVAVQNLQGSPLAVYGEFWQLWRRLKDAPAADIEAFLQREKGSYLADKLRGEWLRQLAKQQDWPQFRRQFPKLVDASDNEFLCLRLQSELADDDSSGLAAAREPLWFTAKDQLAACNPVLDAMQRSGVISEEDRWLRLRLALDANAAGLARYLLAGFGTELSAADLKRIQDAPADYLAQTGLGRRDQRELAAWALGRWARTDFFNALAWLQARPPEDFGEQQAVAWRQIALAAARRFDPEAETFFARSEAAWWPDAQREIRLRLLVRGGRWNEFLEQYDALPKVLRDSRIWRYWQARALKAGDLQFASRRAFARLSTEEDYYGLLAAEQLGQTMGAVTRQIELSEDDRARLTRHAGFQRAFALQALAQRWEAASEWNWAVRTADDRLLLAAAERAERVGWYDRAIYAAERTKTLHDARYRYLAPYREVTRGYARELGLDEAWVYGLIRQESRFVTSARSSAGAGGLMQLMPTTAQWVANRLGVAYHAEMTNAVGDNVRLGTYYLRHVLDSLGHPVLATAGYNAGPRRAREWQGDAVLEGARYVESIPFSETRDYVKKVMTNAVHYARAFGEGETRLSVRLGDIPARVMTPVPIEGP